VTDPTSFRCHVNSTVSQLADTIIEDGGIDIYPTEYLNPIDVYNLSPHDLDLDVGSPVV
jgi:hypothetical protein